MGEIEQQQGWGFETRAIHVGQEPEPTTGAVVVPISLSTTFAQCGNSSPMNVPGTEVLIGWYGPRISTGASGFKSHISMWLGPPSRKTRMHDLALATLPVAA